MTTPQTSNVPVSALMSAPVVTISPEATLRVARATMSETGVHHLLVSDRGRIVGIISDRDIAHRLSRAAERGLPSRHDEEAMERPVIQVAAFQLVTIPATATIEEAAARIIESSVSALPVVNDAGAIVGIVTTRDLLRGMLACVLPQAVPQDEVA